MKNRILTFIIGVLTGAILTIIGFLIYSNTINKNLNLNERMPMEQNRQMQRPNENMGEPPEKPQGNFQGQIQNGEM